MTDQILSHTFNIHDQREKFGTGLSFQRMLNEVFVIFPQEFQTLYSTVFNVVAKREKSMNLV